MKNIALTAALLFAGSGFAHAKDATTDLAHSAFVEHVPYQVSELATDAGIRDLRSRVREAATHVCAPNSIAYRWICESTALQNAYAQIHRAVSRQRSGAQASASNITVRVR